MYNNTMKRYWLFAWSKFYPDGGMNDYISSFYTVEEAKNHFVGVADKYDHYQIVDSQTLNVMESY